jgi:hypothetical protein
MKKLWIFYLIIFLIFEVISLLFLWGKETYSFSIADIFQIVLVVGVIGLAFQKRIFLNIIWKILFVISVVVFLHAWVMMPLVYKFSEGLSFPKIVFIQLFNVPSIPLFVALYIYAWRSSKIWKAST